MGLWRAGFDVVGIDIKPMPRYPFPFIRGDALRPPVRLKDFDLVWASPPCQAHSRARLIHGVEHPNLIPETRALLSAARLSVIENVPGAPMRRDLILCGCMFGLRSRRGRLRRKRWFEVSWPAFAPVPPCSCGHGPFVSVFGHGGHIYHGVQDWRELMEMPWATRDEVAQAIPPAYSEHIGRYAMMALGLDQDEMRRG